MENNFEKNDFYLSFNKKLNKNENILLNIIIKKVIDGSGDILEFKESYLKSTLKLDQDNTLINFFDIFMKKKINYHFKQYNLIENNGSIYIFSSYKCSNKIFTITLSKDFIAIFNKDINVFKNYNFNILLRFENLYTRNFFMLITKKNIFNNFIDLNLDDLKKSLEIENNYSRFYDFEKYILSKIIKELKDIANIHNKYDKIKIANNRKIIALRFYIKDMLLIQLRAQVTKLMSPINSLISNYDKIDKFIERFIINKGVDYVEKNIYYAKLHHRTRFETFLIESIKYNYFASRFDNESKNYSNLIFKLDKKFKDTDSLKKSFVEILKNPKFLHLSDMSTIVDDEFDSVENYSENSLSKKLTPFYNEFTKNLNSYKEYQYEDHLFKILIEFNGIYESHIRVYKK